MVSAGIWLRNGSVTFYAARLYGEQQMLKITSPEPVKTTARSAPTWGRAVPPVAELVAQAFLSSAGSQRVRNRLYRRSSHGGTGAKAEENKFAMRSNPLPRWATICEMCGAECVGDCYCKSYAVKVARENMAKVALIGHSRLTNSTTLDATF